MGKPLMIQPEDDNRIEILKEKTGAKSKVDVVRTALSLLEADVKRAERVKRWERVAKIIGKSGLDVFKEFRTTDRFKNLP